MQPVVDYGLFNNRLQPVAKATPPSDYDQTDVPAGPRKSIKPPDREPVVTAAPDYLRLACTNPVVNVSARAGNESESFVNVNPTNTNSLTTFSNQSSGSSIFRAFSINNGSTWTRGTVATGVACCDGQGVYDTFGNLFMVYINNSVNQINVVLSTDGGVTFGAPITAGSGSVDQPSIAVGNGSVWVDWNVSGSMVARGAAVTGLGLVGAFNAQQAIPSASGSFGGIAVGPGPDEFADYLPIIQTYAVFLNYCARLDLYITYHPVSLNNLLDTFLF